MTTVTRPRPSRASDLAGRRVRRRLLATMLGVLAAGAAPAVACAQEQGAARRPDVHFVPTPMNVVARMLAVARVGAADTLFDLGSGDGRIVIAAARQFGARAIGIDIDPERIAESRRNADTAGVAGRVEFRQADLFETDLRSATVVTLYLLPQLNVRLRPKLFEELRPGTRVVSHDFDMGDWEPDSTMQIDARTVHYWVMPANVAGTWALTTAAGSAERRFEVRLEQQYQRLTGSATSGGRSLAVSDASLRGDSVYVTLTESGNGQSLRLAGRVRGDAMTGAIVRAGRGRAGSWRASRLR